MKQNSTRRGFTLIELLVVVIIIGILAAIALPQYNKAVMKARLTDIQTFIAHVEKAMDLYVLENGYPSSWSGEYIPWDKLGIDVSSYCDSVESSSPYRCTAKNFETYAPSGDPDSWLLSVYYPEFGPSVITIAAYKNGTKSKKCSPIGSLKAKPMCDALKASDPSWVIDLSSAS